jgi:hypothetical protein
MREKLLFVVPFVIGACAQRGTTEEAAAEMTADSGQSGQTEGAFLATSLDGISTGAGLTAPSPESAAAFVASHVAARYSPAGCATATASSATSVVVELAGCTGPRGLRTITGTLDLAFSAADGGALQIDASATGLGVNGAVIDLAATALYASDGGTQTLDVTTHSSGVGALGYDLQHDGDYTVTWDGSCATVDGAWSSERGDRSRSTTADLTRCAAMCPSGQVVRDTADGRTITVAFDGSATASWSSSTGKSGTFALACGE